MSDGWDESAQAWIDSLGEHGDFARRFVLDAPMLALAGACGARTALDVGCGEGRFCRLLKGVGVEATGIDPTRVLLERARQLDPDGVYIEGLAEAMPFGDGQFDLVVSYLSLIDIVDARAAIAEMARVLKLGGTLLVANLQSFATARVKEPRSRDGGFSFRIDHYFEERASWEEWRGIRVLNRHRPLSVYMQAFLAQGLTLTHFEEPQPTGGDPQKAERYRRAPYTFVMAWRR